MATYAKIGSTETLVGVFHTSAGALLTGVVPVVRIRRLSDNFYMDNTGAWAAAPGTEPTMTEVSSANSPGEYEYDFTLPATADIYHVRFDGTAAAADRWQFGELRGIEVDTNDLHKAKAVLLNKQIQTTSTGVVVVRNDADTADLVTLTPSTTTTTRTITPS